MTELGEIPGDWEVETLNSIIDKDRKITYGIVQPGEYDDKGVYIIRAKDYSFGWVKNDSIFKANQEIEKSYARARVKKGDILLTIVGSVGNLAIVPKRLNNANITQQTARLAFDVNKANNIFYYNFLMSDIALKEIKRYMKNGVQPSLNLSDVEKFKVVVPSIREQEKIASILSSVDEQIDNVDGLIEKNKELKKGLMQQLLTKGIGHTKFKKTDIGEIPEEWEVKRLDLIGEIVTGSTPKTSEKDNYGDEYLWVSPGDLGIKKYVTNTVKMLSHKGFSKTRKLPKGAILVTCIGSTIGKMGISRSELSTNQQINSIICNENINSEFIYYALNYNFKMYTSFISTQAVPIINKTTFGEFLIQIPSIQEQTKIALILSELDKKIEEYGNRKEKLEELKKGLMQQLLTGKMRLSK